MQIGGSSTLKVRQRTTSLEAMTAVSWEKGDIELCQRARDGDVDRVRLLVEEEHIGYNVVTNIGTPLVLATEHNQLNVLKYLIGRNDVNIFIQDNEYNGGDTAFHNACRNGWIDCLKSLLEKLKDSHPTEQSHLFNLQNVSEFRTALMLACQWGHYEAVELLFQIINEDERIVPYLELRDKYGKTARDIATERGYEDIKRLFDFEKSWNTHLRRSRRGSHASFVSNVSKDPSEAEFEMRAELECPICWELMESTHIFSCSNSHLFCKSCHADSHLNKCPKCREDFLYYPPKRSALAERWASIIFKRK